jgi:large subunit ribosomal protein L18
MSDTIKIKRAKLKRRHRRIRKRVNGVAECPRLVVHRSLKHVRAALVNDETAEAIAQVSSTAKAFATPEGEGSLKMRRSEAVGTEIARLAKEKGITRVTFDRGGRLYHGRVKGVAESARKGGLEF